MIQEQKKTGRMGSVGGLEKELGPLLLGLKEFCKQNPKLRKL